MNLFDNRSLVAQLICLCLGVGLASQAVAAEDGPMQEVRGSVGISGYGNPGTSGHVTTSGGLTYLRQISPSVNFAATARNVDNSDTTSSLAAYGFMGRSNSVYLLAGVSSTISHLFGAEQSVTTLLGIQRSKGYFEWDSYSSRVIVNGVETRGLSSSDLNVDSLKSGLELSFNNGWTISDIYGLVGSVEFVRVFIPVFVHRDKSRVTASVDRYDEARVTVPSAPSPRRPSYQLVSFQIGIRF